MIQALVVVAAPALDPDRSIAREAKDSTQGFCHGLPGSMYAARSAEAAPIPERVRGRGGCLRGRARTPHHPCAEPAS